MAAAARADCCFRQSDPSIGEVELFMPATHERTGHRRAVRAYVSTVEDPGRFSRSRSVGAHLGLTPRQYQSGEVDRSGRISKGGATLARTLLYEAAVVILSRVKRASSLKDWGRAFAKRLG